MNTPDIIAQVCCNHAPHPSTCSVCFSAIISDDKAHEHFQWATKEGFKPLNMHAPCAKAWKAGSIRNPQQPRQEPPATGAQDGIVQ